MQPIFEIQTDAYSGPFPVLLELIEKKKLSISTLSLAEITDDYIAYVRTLDSLNIDELSQFILVAATLMLIKSKALLPQFEIEKEEQSDVDILEKRLITFELIKGLSGLLKEQFKMKNYIFRRRTIKSKKINFSPLGLDLEKLTVEIDNVLNVLPQEEKLPETKIKSNISLENIILNLMDRINNTRKLTWSELKNSTNNTEAKEVKKIMIVTFLALLELVRSGSYDSEQSSEYGEITLTTIN